MAGGYGDPKRARDEDVLVRNKAAASLSETADELSRLAADFGKRCIPPSNREQPFPPADLLTRQREIEELREKASGLSSAIRGMAAPTKDATWARFRDERETLARLLDFDRDLLLQAGDLAGSLKPLGGPDWSDDQASALRGRLDALERLSAERHALLNATLF